MSSGLTIRIQREEACTILVAIGEIDIATVGQLREQLLPFTDSGHLLIADLDQVSFIDAGGMRALASAGKRLAMSGGCLRVVCGQARIRRLFKITGMNSDISFASTVSEARHPLTREKTRGPRARDKRTAESPPRQRPYRRAMHGRRHLRSR